MHGMRLTWSYRWHLAWVMLLMLFATTGLSFILNYQIEKQILTDQIRQRARLVGKTIRLNLSHLLAGEHYPDLSSLPAEGKQEIREFIRHFSEEEATFDIYSENEGIHDLFFIDAGNRVIIDDPAQNEGRILPSQERIDPESVESMRQNGIDAQIQLRGKDTMLLMTFPVLQRGRLLGFGRIEMVMNSAVALLDKIKLWGMITAGGLFLIGVVLSTYLAKRVTQPIGELVDAAARIGRGDFGRRLDESRKDEIGVLMATFNRMADGIRKLEETQQRVKKLEIAGQLAALVAHEIKNPLNSIGLTIDHLKDRFAPADQHERDKFLALSQNITQEVDRLNQIVESFLRSAKPTPLSRQPTDLNDLADETLASLAPQAERQQVKIHRHFDRALPKLSVDYHQLRQALMNLLINALQAMPNGGELRLSTSIDTHDRREVGIAIEDTGCGIPPEHLPRLFDPYFTTKPRGFGLGLSMVEQIVQNHGGRIDISSRIGNGSVFTILLPISTDEPHA